MTNVQSLTLSFSTIDELALAAERGYLDEVEFPTLLACDLGPLFEFSRLASRGLLPSIRNNYWLRYNELAEMVTAFRAGAVQWVCPKAQNKGYLRTSIGREGKEWISFGVAAQRAAVRAGFGRVVAAQFVAVLGELHSNVLEHSGSASSGVVAFQARDGTFELIAVDGGMGILSSLRSNRAYARLSDSGEALLLALAEGISRFGEDTSRGYGFRPLFVGLANLNSFMRFRSGDHALVIDGRNPALKAARTAQKPDIAGFVVSVKSLVDE